MQCCNEFRLSWNHAELIKSGKLIPSPLGTYKKSIIKADNSIVYHNDNDNSNPDDDYYLYTLGDEWVVSNRLNND